MTDETAQEKKDLYFMELALVEARSALKAGEFPVGCIIADGDRVVAKGGRTGTTGKHINEVDHAEISALKALSKQGRDEDRRRYTIYTTLEPCLMCYGAILLSNIGRIVYAYEDVMGGGVACDLSRLTPLYRERPIIVRPYVRREGSLALLKAFFEDPACTYWSDSLLARYTIEQG